jgi:hypothetical protein
MPTLPILLSTVVVTFRSYSGGEKADAFEEYLTYGRSDMTSKAGSIMDRP